jgi:uncharacterized protein (DUF1330 family)
MPFIEPTREQFEQLMALDQDQPIVMVNLLRFKPDGGRATYTKYLELSRKCAENVDANLVYYGECLMPVIGNEEWDAVLLAEYPSIDAFIQMQRDKEYQATVVHRSESLADSRLYVTRPAE